ncbi:hypothetical protein Cob_v006704 [Colletotrichum orbiculare MAFF 240422]|uniref:Uncharacterized protein n=1 Tax=Colletotrichum orbiculare (strain 104-T / ATCC 96160 / CBS 514.97 / LARS 414 / MAFF 240422) TaxID=1213857 RepID=A0A484FU97_COLOR|nr:hypothetical protein Cob_v006704 [Colletotrichum orbiculare MAFF 240422]
MPICRLKTTSHRSSQDSAAGNAQTLFQRSLGIAALRGCPAKSSAMDVRWSACFEKHSRDARLVEDPRCIIRQLVFVRCTYL